MDNYLTKSLIDWVDEHVGVDSNNPSVVKLVNAIEDEFLPEFEAALHRLHAGLDDAV